MGTYFNILLLWFGLVRFNRVRIWITVSVRIRVRFSFSDRVGIGVPDTE